MNSPTSLSLQVIQEQIAQHEARIATLHLLIANKPLSFEDLLKASDVLVLLGHELERWKALEELVRGSGPREE
jgi:hypothetical protein